MAKARTPRRTWIEEGLSALAGGGPNAVRVEALAEAIGVTKGGFYWHFADRKALLDEMLDSWERSMVDGVIERVEAEGGEARERLRLLFALASTGDVRRLLKVELAVRDWARRDETVARRLQAVDNRRMDYMRALFGDFCHDADDVEVRCMYAFSLFTGSHFIVAEHGTRSRAEVLRMALDRLLKA